jgi:hypothetical protein
MISRAEILTSFIGELRRFERRVEALALANEAQVIATRRHLNDTLAQMAEPSDDASPPIRENGSFLPPPFLC